MKLIYVFSKKGRLRFVSHLELQKFLLRALGRTKLPVAYSQGFNPHPLLSLAGALAMGYESEYEVFELRVSGEVTKDFALSEMQRALPPEMRILDVVFRPDNHPAMMSLVKMADYLISPQERAQELCDAARGFEGMESFMGIRKSKSDEREVDVRKLCRSISVESGMIRARLMLTEQETLKPDLLIATLSRIAGIEAPACRVLRTGLYGLDGKGQICLIHLL